MAWKEPSGYQICDPNSEIYLRSYADVAQPEQFITELQCPVIQR